MSALARGQGDHGAECDLSGTIPVNVSWMEDLYFFDADGAALDISGLTFTFQFRSSPHSTSADVTISTTAGTLSIEADGGAVESILRIDVPATTFANYQGDMVADLIAEDLAGDTTLYAHGIVTFLNNPGVAV